jgi:hypothetical protein
MPVFESSTKYYLEIQIFSSVCGFGLVKGRHCRAILLFVLVFKVNVGALMVKVLEVSRASSLSFPSISNCSGSIGAAELRAMGEMLSKLQAGRKF